MSMLMRSWQQSSSNRIAFASIDNMNLGVFRLGHHLKILKAVICNIAIDVVNDLIFTEAPAQFLFSN